MPWSVPAAVGMVCGVAVSGAAPVPAALVAAVSCLALCWPAYAMGSGRGVLVAALPLLLGAALGCLRHEAWEARPDPSTDVMGQEALFEGRYDGVWFDAHTPVAARFALVHPEEIHPGDVVLRGTARPAQGKRNPGGFDYAAYLRRRGVSGQLFVAEVVSHHARRSLRTRLAEGVAARLPPASAALLVAMTLGLRDDLDREERDRFARAGLSHLLALSGLHFGVLLAAADAALRRYGAARRSVLIALCLGFVALVGPSPSVVRSSAMAVTALAAQVAGVGRVATLPVLSLAACVSLTLQPQMLYDLSFQLSYLALLGLITLSGPLCALLGAPTPNWDPARPELPVATPGQPARPSLRARAVQAAAVSVAAQLPSASLVASSFGSVPVLSAVVNVVAVPLAGVVVPLGFVGGLLGAAWQPLGDLAGLATTPLMAALRGIAWLGARLPAASWHEVGALGHLCWAVGICGAALAAHGALSRRRAVIVLAVAAIVPAAVGPRAGPPDVWFLDVGQGDATLLRLGGGVDVLVDGGGSPFSDRDVGGTVVLPALRALGVRELDMVVATHPDADHVEGLLTVLEETRVGVLVTGPPLPGNHLDERLRAVAARRRVPVHVARRGEAYELGGSGRAVLEVLHPPAGESGASANEGSVVMLVRYLREPALLLMADAGTVTEVGLAVPRVHVLKVGHHGSRHSTSVELLTAARPELAVVSVGENGYGHPHPAVLERLAAFGASVVSTLEVGAVRVPLGRDAAAR